MTVLARIGGAATAVALALLGVGAGLWIGQPASAATAPLEVDLGGGFTSSPSGSLLDVPALVPGSTVTGTMSVRDVSDTGAGFTDTITLVIPPGHAVSDTCVSPVTCDGAGQELKDALTFTLTVTGSGTIPAHGPLTADDLIDGVVLASGLAPNDVINVTLSAALPNGSPADDNPLQNGQFSFDLGLALDAVAVTGGDTGPGGGAGPGGNDFGGDGDSGASDGIEVQDTGAVEPTRPAGEKGGKPGASGNGSTAGSTGKGSGDVLVLGKDKSLSYTGAPITALLTVGGMTLAGGLLLFVLARRRTRRS